MIWHDFVGLPKKMQLKSFSRMVQSIILSILLHDMDDRSCAYGNPAVCFIVMANQSSIDVFPITLDITYKKIGFIKQKRATFPCVFFVATFLVDPPFPVPHSIETLHTRPSVCTSASSRRGGNE